MQDINKELEALTGKSIIELEHIVRNLPDTIEAVNITKPYGAADSETCAEIGIGKGISVGLCADLKLDGSDWHVNFKARMYLLGVQIWNEGGSLNKDHSATSFHIDLKAVKCTVTIGMEDFTHFCPFVDWKGEVYIPIIGWKTLHFHKQIFCLR